MHEDNNKVNIDLPAAVRKSLQSISIGSYLFQSSIAAELGLHPSDLVAIHILGLSIAGLKAGELAQKMKLSSGATTALAARLEKKGYIKRLASPKDRRQIVITLKSKARERLKKKYEVIDARVTTALAKRSHTEIAVISDFLSDLIVQV